jgi:hypothetical protein
VLGAPLIFLAAAARARQASLAGFATAIACVVLVWGVLYALIESAIFIFANEFN